MATGFIANDYRNYNWFIDRNENIWQLRLELVNGS